MDPGGVINHKLCVITTSQTNRLQGRFETRTWVRSGGCGGYLSGLINLIASCAQPGLVGFFVRFFFFIISEAGTLLLSAAASHQKRCERRRGEPGRAGRLSETGNPPRCGDVCMFNLHSGSPAIYLSSWMWPNIQSRGVPMINLIFKRYG